MSASLMNLWPVGLLIATPLIPLLAAALVLLFRRQTWLHYLTPLVALPALLAALLCPPDTSVTLTRFMLGSRIAIDATGQWFLLFTAAMWTLAGAQAIGYMRGKPRLPAFFGCFLLTLSGNLGLIVAQDSVTFLANFALMSFAAYGLIVHDDTTEARAAGKVYIILVIAGETLLFPAIMLAAALTGSTDFQALPQAFTSPVGHALMVLLLLGFGIKAGALPLHVWLPLAHPVAPTPASAVLSGCMIKAGLLGWLRTLPLGTLAMPGWGATLISAGTIAYFYGILCGLAQPRVKTLLAYSSISKMGLMAALLGFALRQPDAWPALAGTVMVFATYHAITKGALFLSAGVTTPPATGRLGRALTLTALIIPALSLSAAPFTAGGMAEAALKLGMYPVKDPFAAPFMLLVPLGALLTSLLAFKYLLLTRDRLRTETHHPLPTSCWIAWLAAVTLTLLLPFLHPQTAIGKAWTKSLTPELLWIGFWPAASGLALGLLLQRRGGTRLLPACIPAGDILGLYTWCLRTLGAPAFKGLSRLLAGMRNAPFMILTVTAHSNQIYAALRAGERQLGNWKTFGSLFLAVVLLLIAIGAMQTR